MEITLQLMEIGDKPLLVRLMEFYLYDFSEFSGEDVGEYGYYGYTHIDDYWNEPGRFPYLIRVDGQIAGFALICPHCGWRAEPDARCIGEFFVMRKYRHRGVGRTAAVRLFDRHPGPWEVSCWKTNPGAGRFWETVIGAYTKGRYEIRETAYSRERGILFENRQ